MSYGSKRLLKAWHWLQDTAIALRDDKRGATLAMFAAAFVPTMAVTGASVDFARAQLARAQLATAADSACLAGGGAFLDSETARTAEVTRYLAANYNANRFGTTAPVTTTSFVGPVQVADGSQEMRVQVTATADLNTTFLRVININTLPVKVDCEAALNQGALELILVLDVTGSMAGTVPGDTVSRIDALRAATLELINIFYGATETNQNLRIGILPYAQTVNVGHELRAQNQMQIPSALSTYVDSPDARFGWWGCIQERATDTTINGFVATNTTIPATAYDILDTPANTSGSGFWTPYYANRYVLTTTGQGTYGWNWYVPPTGYPAALEMTRASQADTHTGGGTGGAPLTTTTVPANHDQKASRSGSTQTGPNLFCPPRVLLPSASNTKTQLITYATNNLGSDDIGGWTFSDMGMSWGRRILSPQLPFASNVPYDDPTVRKAIIFMTDGFITAGRPYNHNEGYDGSNQGTNLDRNNGNDVPKPFFETGYGGAWERRLRGTHSYSANNWVRAREQRLAMVCQDAKRPAGWTQTRDAMRVYVVTFGFTATEAASSQAQVYRDCASQDSFFNAPNAETLRQRFRFIASDLAGLRLSQ
jgi:Flp pilus assembly protein TadG